MELQTYKGKDIEVLENFPRAKQVRVGRSETQQIWGRIEETSIKLLPPAAYMTKLREFFIGRLPVYVHPFLYRAPKLTFPSVLSFDGTIEREMGQGLM